ncbi:hypothetical protein CsSME_00013484 [Camellia sinensis var. sinensis]
MALHDFILRHNELDEVTMAIPDSDDYMAPQMPDHDEYTRAADVMEEWDSDPAMAAVKVNITNQLVRQTHR